MPKQIETIYDCEDFNLIKARDGFWLWNKLEKCNNAIRAKDELSAYREAIHMLNFSLSLCQERRDKAESALAVLQTAFETVFPSDED
jgi:hypothetical protein